MITGIGRVRSRIQRRIQPRGAVVPSVAPVQQDNVGLQTRDLGLDGAWARITQLRDEEPFLAKDFCHDCGDVLIVVNDQH
jgi:hypothetical protein